MVICVYCNEDQKQLKRHQKTCVIKSLFSTDIQTINSCIKSYENYLSKIENDNNLEKLTKATYAEISWVKSRNMKLIMEGERVEHPLVTLSECKINSMVSEVKLLGKKKYRKKELKICTNISFNI